MSRFETIAILNEEIDERSREASLDDERSAAFGRLLEVRHESGDPTRFGFGFLPGKMHGEEDKDTKRRDLF